MKISVPNIIPLVFYPNDDPLATELRFTQRFGRYDHIVLQCVADVSAVFTAHIRNAYSNQELTTKTCIRTQVGSNLWNYSVVLDVIPEGMWYVILAGGGSGVRSEAFEVTRLIEDDTEWALLEYGGSRNDVPIGDALFVVGGIRLPFLLRLPAGFKPSGWEGSVQAETYRTQRQELRVLYSATYDKYTRTIGTAAGLPIEYIRLLNNILSCEYVYINGERYCRSEGSVPEKQLVMTGAQMFTASVLLEKQPTLDNYSLEVYQNGDEYNNDYNNDYDI